jgi:hypothetical protein
VASKVLTSGLEPKLFDYKPYWRACDVVNVRSEALLAQSFDAQFEHYAKRLHDVLVAAIVKRIDVRTKCTRSTCACVSGCCRCAMCRLACCCRAASTAASSPQVWE